MKPTRQFAGRWWVGLLACVLLLGVFGLYGRPDFMVMMANQLWSCF